MEAAKGMTAAQYAKAIIGSKDNIDRASGLLAGYLRDGFGIDDPIGPKKETLLHKAVGCISLELVKLMRANNASMDKRDWLHRTPFDKAETHVGKHPDMVKIVIYLRREQETLDEA